MLLGTDFLDLHFEFYQETKKNLQTYVKDPGQPNEIIPEFGPFVINKLTAKDAIFKVDTGMGMVWVVQYIDGTGMRKMPGSFNRGSMGEAKPPVIGWALDCPDQ